VTNKTKYHHVKSWVKSLGLAIHVEYYRFEQFSVYNPKDIGKPDAQPVGYVTGKLRRYYRRVKRVDGVRIDRNGFSPDPRGGKVIVIVTNDHGQEVARGEQRCMLIDNFSYAYGRYWATDEAAKGVRDWIDANAAALKAVAVFA